MEKIGAHCEFGVKLEVWQNSFRWGYDRLVNINIENSKRGKRGTFVKLLVFAAPGTAAVTYAIPKRTLKSRAIHGSIY